MTKPILQEMITRAYATLTPGDTLARTAGLLRRTKFDGLPVTDGQGRLLGLMTKSNLYEAVSRGISPDTQISAFYIKDPVTTTEATPYDELMRILQKHPVGTGVVVDEDNRPTALVSKTDWIEAMFRKETLLIHQNETLESVMEIAYDGIVVVDRQTRITMINQAALKLFGIDNPVGRPAGDIIENTLVHIVIKTGLPEKNKLQIINNSPYVVTTLPIRKKGRVIGAVCKIMFNDTTELKRLAERLADLDRELAYYKDAVAHDPDGTAEFEAILTRDPDFTALKEEAQIASRGLSSVLITGESGTGKELFAKAIHRSGINGKGPLVRVNCAAIPDSLLEAEFFGYAPGAFTDAAKKGKTGKLMAADNGTLFLDEIGDMSFSLQSKLLRVLQDKQFEPVGSNRSIKVNTRFIAATNQDLIDLVARGKFRKDLYYRLNVINLDLPPLRQRTCDIEVLAEYFLAKHNKTFGTSVAHISEEVAALLNAHDWPGNVRELENVIERAINFARTQFLEITDLPLYLREKSGRTAPVFDAPAPRASLKCHVDTQEKELILRTLESAGGNRAKTARMLGISRSWLYKKMARAGIT
ncbi:MAG: sigma 54-interacting transcriptional regulator [Desulfobacterales bacterium]|nr:sigma 54-interacting transcriptional regulator [Desulfobacterales bacterium]